MQRGKNPDFDCTTYTISFSNRMHGRVKIRTSEEQAAAKKLEREKKIKKFQNVTNEIYTKREADSLDEELLKLTETLLAWNPDHYTIWNIRREVIEQLLVGSEVEAKTELFKRELNFLEMCLKVNPKSYGVFTQRRWVMSHTPTPDWTHEIALCDLFLSYDERNFHCWDYRRLVRDTISNINPPLIPHTYMCPTQKPPSHTEAI